MAKRRTTVGAHFVRGTARASSAELTALGNLLFVSPSGSDATGASGRIDLPYQTLNGAKAAAVAGDTIVVFPGVYDERDLLKHLVNWHFWPGAIVQYTGAADGAIWDNVAGTSALGAARVASTVATAVTCKITGKGQFIMNPVNDGNWTHVFGIQQANSDIEVECSLIQENCQNVAIAECCGIRHHGGRVSITCEKILANAFPIWWTDGELYVRTTEIVDGAMSSGAIYTSPGTDPQVGGVGNGMIEGPYTSGFLWVEAKVIRTNSIGGYGMQLIGVGAGTAARVWIFVQDIIIGAASGAGIMVDGLFAYINCLKLDANASGDQTINQVGGQFWLTAQKISCGTSGLNVTGGKLYLEAHSIESKAATTYLLTNAGGTVDFVIQSRLIGGAAAKGIIHTGGATVFNGRIDTSANVGGAGYGIQLSGAGCIADGYIKTEAATVSVFAAAAQTIRTVNGLKGSHAKHANVTLTAEASV